MANTQKIEKIRRKIDYLRNDNDKNPELLERADRLLDELDNRADDRIDARADSQNARLTELEQILEQIETVEFVRRFEIAEKIIPLLEKNPNLTAAEITNPQFQSLSAEEQQNVLDDARQGKKVNDLLASKDFDWKDPQAYLEKAKKVGGKAGETANKITEAIQKHPILFGACLIAGGIALYKFFKKDSDLGDKISGVAAGGLSAFLGASLFREGIGGTMLSFFGEKLVGKKNWDKVRGLFGGEDDERKEKPQTPEAIEKYGVMVPLSEAIGHYKEDAKYALLPFAEAASRNKDAIAILAAVGFAESEKFRSLASGAVSMTADKMTKLAKLPFKVIKGYPVASVFAVSAVLLNLEALEGGVKNFRVPKDTENMKLFLRAKLAEAGEKLPDLDIPHISDANLDITAAILTGTKSLSEFIAPAEEVLAGLGETGLESATLTPEKLIQKRNLYGVGAFWFQVSKIAGKNPNESSQKILIEIDNLKTKIKSGKTISAADIEKMRELVKPLGIVIVAEDGRMKSVLLDENGVTHPRSICIDPSLSTDKQFEISKGFFVESDSWLEAGGKVVSIPVEQLRIAAGGLFENAETESEVGAIIERKLKKDGWIITIAGGTLSLVSKAGEKYILGGAEMVWGILNIVPGGEDFSCTELAIEYAEGILPIAAIGTASAIARGNIKSLFSKKALFEAAAYPISGTKKLWSQIFRPLLIEKNPSKILNNASIQISSSFKEVLHNFNAKVAGFQSRFFKKYEYIWGAESRMRDLNEIKKIFSEAQFHRSPNTKKKLLDQARKIIDHSKLEKEFFGGKGIFRDNYRATERNLETAIQKCEELINKQKQNLKKYKERTSRKSRVERAPVSPEVAVEKTRTFDEKIVAEREAFAAKKRKILESGKSVREPEVRGKLKEVAANSLAKMKDLYSQRLKFVGELPTDLVKRYKLDLPQIKISVPSRMKKIGKGLVGVAAMLTAFYAAGEVVTWATEDDPFSNELIDTSEIISQPNKQVESVESNKESMALVADYFGVINFEYDQIFAGFSPENLKNWDENRLQEEVEKVLATHTQNINKIKKFVETNQDSIRQFYRERPELDNTHSLGKLFSLGCENEEVILEFADEDDVRDELYEQVDYINRNLETLLAGEAPSDYAEMAHAASYAIPGYGTGLDATDAWKHFKRGNFDDAAISTAWAVVGGVSDIAMLFWGAGLAGKALRGSKAAAKIAQISKAKIIKETLEKGRFVAIGKKALEMSRAEKISKLLQSGKFQIGMSGADLIRPIWKPRLSETVRFAAAA